MAMAHESARVTVSTFYHFAPLPDPALLKTATLERMRELDLRGTITFAHEGVNATIAGREDAIAHMIAELRQLPGFAALTHRLSNGSSAPFGRSKVKVKRELISLGAKADPSVCVGIHIDASEWNALITSPDVITIDTRNDYEYAIGHFQGALNPATRNFKEMVAFTTQHLDPAIHKRIAMYCTGGIRCEKYSAYLLTQGFEQVYHLKGGILSYLETIRTEQSLWQGECYVFDERVAVGHGLIPSPDATMCLGCGRPLYTADRNDPIYIEGKQCKACAHG